MRTIDGIHGFSIPCLGMGTWCFGGKVERDPENDDAGQIAALQAGIAAGFTLIDTAEYYAAGYAETLVGRAIAGYDRRRLFLTSKVWKSHLRRDDVRRAAEATLRRLGTDYLDLYLYHQPSDEVPLEETVGAMNELVAEGMVRAIGVSNFAADRLRRAYRATSVPFAVNQYHYNLAVREVEPEILGICREAGTVLQAWRPIRDLRESPLTVELCRKYSVTLAQLAIGWLLAQPGVATIVAMRDPRHIPESLAALELRLTPEECRALRDDYPYRAASGVPLR